MYNLIHEFLITMAFTMACPNFKKGLKMVSGPLGVNSESEYIRSQRLKEWDPRGRAAGTLRGAT
jgi:serine protease inhibitor ecotin